VKAVRSLREKGGSPCERISTHEAGRRREWTVRSPSKPGRSECLGCNASEPECSPVTQWGGRAPPDQAKAAPAAKQDIVRSSGLPRGIRDGTCTEEHTEHGRPRWERIATATGGTRRQPRPSRPSEESDGVMSDEGAVMALEQETPAVRHVTRSSKGPVIA